MDCSWCGKGFHEHLDYPFVDGRRVHWECVDEMEASGLFEYEGVELRYE